MALRMFDALLPYFGSKRKLCPVIFHDIDRHFQRCKWRDAVFVDAFLGSCAVSLYAKAQGFRVIANDIAERSYIAGKSLIENSQTLVTEEDIYKLFRPNEENKHLIEQGYVPKVFIERHAKFLDLAFANATRYIDKYLLIKYMLHLRPYSKFSSPNAFNNNNRGMNKVYRWVEADTRLDAYHKRQQLMAEYVGKTDDSDVSTDFDKAREELKRTLNGDNRPIKTVQLYAGTYNRVFVDFRKIYEAKHKVSITSLLELDSSYFHEYKDYYTIDLKRKWRAEIIRTKSILTKLRMKKLIKKELLYDVREELHTPSSEPLPYLNIPDTELEKLFSYIKQRRLDYYRPYRYMYLTGRRPGETSLYEKRDVVPNITDPQELHIRKEITKSKRDSVIFLAGELKTLIQDALRGNSTKWLFPNRKNRKCWKDGLYKYLRRVSKKVIEASVTPRYFRKHFHTTKIPISMKDAMAVSGLKDTRVAMEHYAYSTREGQAKILAGKDKRVSRRKNRRKSKRRNGRKDKRVVRGRGKSACKYRRRKVK